MIPKTGTSLVDPLKVLGTHPNIGNRVKPIISGFILWFNRSYGCPAPQGPPFPHFPRGPVGPVGRGSESLARLGSALQAAAMGVAVEQSLPPAAALLGLRGAAVQRLAYVPVVFLFSSVVYLNRGPLPRKGNRRPLGDLVDMNP